MSVPYVVSGLVMLCVGGYADDVLSTLQLIQEFGAPMANRLQPPNGYFDKVIKDPACSASSATTPKMWNDTLKIHLSDAAHMPYSIIQFVPSQTGVIGIDVNAEAPAGKDFRSIPDMELHLHCGVFDPVAPLKNLYAYVDDSDRYFQPKITLSDGVPVTQGNTYYAVVQQAQTYHKKAPIKVDVTFSGVVVTGKVWTWKDLLQCADDESDWTACADQNATTHEDYCLDHTCKSGRNSHPDCGGYGTGMQCSQTPGGKKDKWCVWGLCKDQLDSLECFGENGAFLDGVSCNDGNPNTFYDSCNDVQMKCTGYTVIPQCMLNGQPRYAAPCKVDLTTPGTCSLLSYADTGIECHSENEDSKEINELAIICQDENGNALPDGAFCDDGHEWTPLDECSDGMCIWHYADQQCVDANGHFTAAAPCDDGDALTFGDSCEVQSTSGDVLCQGYLLTKACTDPKGEAMPNGAKCDDKNNATIMDQCVYDTVSFRLWCKGYTVFPECFDAKQFLQSDKTCDDKNNNTFNDRCNDFGKCKGTFVDSACVKNGVPVAVGTTCDDQNSATAHDVCVQADMSTVVCRGCNPRVDHTCVATAECGSNLVTALLWQQEKEQEGKGCVPTASVCIRTALIPLLASFNGSYLDQHPHMTTQATLLSPNATDKGGQYFMKGKILAADGTTVISQWNLGTQEEPLKAKVAQGKSEYLHRFNVLPIGARFVVLSLGVYGNITVDNVQLIVDACCDDLANPCANGGTCRNEDHGVACQCKVGFHGDYCQTVDSTVTVTTRSLCAKVVCSYGSCISYRDVLQPAVVEAKCQCEAGWEGTACDVDIDGCKGDPCGANETCVDVPAKSSDSYMDAVQFYCSCNLGFGQCQREGWQIGESKIGNLAFHYYGVTLTLIDHITGKWWVDKGYVLPRSPLSKDTTGVCNVSMTTSIGAWTICQSEFNNLAFAYNNTSKAHIRPDGNLWLAALQGLAATSASKSNVTVGACLHDHTLTLGHWRICVTEKDYVAFIYQGDPRVVIHQYGFLYSYFSNSNFLTNFGSLSTSEPVVNELRWDTPKCNENVNVLEYSTKNANNSMQGWNVTKPDTAQIKARNGELGWFVVGQYYITSVTYPTLSRFQLIDLTERFSLSFLDAAPVIQAQEDVSGNGFKDDYFYIKVQLLDANLKVLAEGVEGSPAAMTRVAAEDTRPGHRFQFMHTFADYGSGLRYVRFEDGGKAGEYTGSKSANVMLTGPKFSNAAVTANPCCNQARSPQDNVCSHGATCEVDSNGKYECRCVNGYKGVHCNELVSSGPPLAPLVTARPATTTATKAPSMVTMRLSTIALFTKTLSTDEEDTVEAAYCQMCATALKTVKDMKCAMEVSNHNQRRLLSVAYNLMAQFQVSASEVNSTQSRIAAQQAAMRNAFSSDPSVSALIDANASQAMLLNAEVVADVMATATPHAGLPMVQQKSSSLANNPGAIVGIVIAALFIVVVAAYCGMKFMSPSGPRGKTGHRKLSQNPKDEDKRHIMGVAANEEPELSLSEGPRLSANEGEIELQADEMQV